CVAACPVNIIFAGDGGFPEISFKNGECTFCGDCVTACMPKALLKVDGRAPWTLKARILEDKCLTYQGVTCRVCGERCDAGAISFASARGQTERININQGICTGCGACFYPCPAEAVEVSPGHPLEPQAEEPSKRRP
ncbi:MAG: ferredoxin-type protein NapF, partial [Rhodospirillales bacterium]|nr:ferredoxin-type protein NapF [Rhodospirillales bacterium]